MCKTGIYALEQKKPQPQLKSARVIKRLPRGLVLIQVAGVGMVTATNDTRRAGPGEQVGAVLLGGNWRVV